MLLKQILCNSVLMRKKGDCMVTKASRPKWPRPCANRLMMLLVQALNDCWGIPWRQSLREVCCLIPLRSITASHSQYDVMFVYQHLQVSATKKILLTISGTYNNNNNNILVLTKLTEQVNNKQKLDNKRENFQHLEWKAGRVINSHRICLTYCMNKWSVTSLLSST